MLDGIYNAEHDTIESLCHEWKLFCDLNNLPQESADEISREGMTAEQDDYLDDFLNRWNAII